MSLDRSDHPPSNLDEMLLEVLRPPAWIRDALCTEPAYQSTEFFPERGASSEPARAVCKRCLVREECLDWATAQRIPDGIWGGLDAPERRERLRTRRTAS